MLRHFRPVYHFSMPWWTEGARDLSLYVRNDSIHYYQNSRNHCQYVFIFCALVQLVWRCLQLASACSIDFDSLSNRNSTEWMMMMPLACHVYVFMLFKCSYRQTCYSWHLEVFCLVCGKSGDMCAQRKANNVNIFGASVTNTIDQLTYTLASMFCIMCSARITRRARQLAPIDKK